MVDGAITKAFVYVLSPALHTAAAKGIELSSGTSTAQFLMVFCSFFSLMSHALLLSLEEEIFFWWLDVRNSTQSAGIFVVASSSCRLDGADSFAQWGIEYLSDAVSRVRVDALALRYSKRIFYNDTSSIPCLVRLPSI